MQGMGAIRLSRNLSVLENLDIMGHYSAHDKMLEDITHKPSLWRFVERFGGVHLMARDPGSTQMEGEGGGPAGGGAKSACP